MLVSQSRLFGIACRHLSFSAYSWKHSEDGVLLGEASLYFPLVGFVFGFGFILTYFIFASFARIELSCLVVLLVMVKVFTGRQYQSCLKFFDVLGQLKDVDEKDANVDLTQNLIRILLIFGLFTLKLLALTHLGKGWLPAMLALVPVVSCWSKVYLCHSFSSYVSESGELSYMRSVKGKQFWGATFFTTLVAGVFMGLEGLFLLMFISLWTEILDRWVVTRPRQILGPMVGVVMELNEILLLLGLIVMRKGFALSGEEGVWL